MKKLTLLLFATFLSIQGFSQNWKIGSWKVKSIGLTTGVDQDMMKTMDDDYFLKGTRTATDLPFSAEDFTSENMYSMICENPNIKLDLAFESPVLKNTEIRVGLNAIFDRIDAVSYYTDGANGYSHMNFSAYGSEVALEIAAVKKKTLGNRVNIYGGLGTNLGYTFGNELYVYGSSETFVNETSSFSERRTVTTTVTSSEYEYFDDYYKLNNGMSQRIFGQVGIGVRVFKGLEIGGEFKRGVGYRVMGGTNTKGTQLVGAGAFLRYNLAW